MIRCERLDRMNDFVRKRKYASIQELMEEFCVSRATVRRDLLELAESNKLSCARGGVYSNEPSTKYELSYSLKDDMNRDEKVRIGIKAAALVKEDSTIMLDSGTTVNCFASQLAEKRCVAATSDIKIAMTLTENSEIEVIFVGGGYIRKGFYTVIGRNVEDMLLTLHFDTVFLSCDAFDFSFGAMITNNDEVSLKRAMIESARKVILLCDHGKFGKLAFSTVCQSERISMIITGKEIDSKSVSQAKESGIDIVLV